MRDEIMPIVTEPAYRKRTLWIENLKEDRHTDVLFWTRTEDEGTNMVELSEAQTRYLSEVLLNHIASWDTGL